MTTTDLKLKLYREAVADGTVGLCWLVGRTLGQSLPADPERLIFRSRSLTILVHEREHYCCVWYRGVPVCLTRMDGWLFLPGPWTDHLRELAVRARRQNELEEARASATAL